MLCEVTYLHYYPDFARLFEGIHSDYPDWKVSDFIQEMRQYYLRQDELKYGAVEIGLKLT